MGTCTNWLTMSWVMFAFWDNSKPVETLTMRQFFFKVLSSMFYCTLLRIENVSPFRCLQALGGKSGVGTGMGITLCWDFLFKHEKPGNQMASSPGLLLLRSYFIVSGCNLRPALSCFLELR